MDNGVSVESIRVVSEIDDLVNLEGKIVMHKVTPVGKQVSIDYTTDLWETYYNVLAKESCSLSSEKDLYLFEVSTFKNPNAPLYLEFAVKCDIAGSVFWTNGYQFLYDEDSQKEFFFNEFQSSSPSPSSISSPVDNEKECILCLEEFDCNEFVKITDQCNHENDICKKCIRKHVKKEILDNEEDNELLNEGNFDILCPDDDCRAVLKEQDVKRFVSEKMFNRYEQLKLNFTLSLIPNFYRCTNQDCYSGQIHEGEDTSPIMTCIACNQKSCVVHNLPFDNIRFCCPECEKLEPVSPSNPSNEAEGTEVKKKRTSLWKRLMPDKKNSPKLREIEIEKENAKLLLKNLEELEKAEIRKQQEEKRKSHKVKKQEKKSEDYIRQLKQCPACKSRIQKSGGCDKMTCGNPRCRHEFCWICLAENQNHRTDCKYYK